MSVIDTIRHESNAVIFERYTDLGYNYRLTDIQASIGRVQLERLPHIIDKRRYLATRYFELFSEFPNLSLPDEPAWARSNWQSFSIRINNSINQKKLMQFLRLAI